MLQADEASEVERCIGGSGMHQRSTEVDRAARPDGAQRWTELPDLMELEVSTKC
jgi:hypothetical protein